MNKGFTLIEVLIGLFIAVIASISVAQVIASTNKVVDAGRKTFVATNLAHEGLELTREIRDDTWFSNPDRGVWMAQLCPDDQTHTYTIDPDLARARSIASDTVQDLYIQDNKTWTHAKTEDTKTGYSRLMRVDCKNVKSVPAYVTISSTVRWMGAQNVVKSIMLQEQLYNWLP